MRRRTQQSTATPPTGSRSPTVSSPEASVVLWGAQDTEHARIHASDESVDPAELERMIASQVLLLHRLAEAG